MESASVRPPQPGTVLNPAARVLWRSAHCVQLELGAARVVLDGVDTPVVRRLLGRPAGCAPREPADETTRQLQDHLTIAGFLWPVAPDDDDLRLAPPSPRLAPELTALTARHGDRAAELLNARRHVSVAIQGRGRIGPQLAVVLAAAGVGRVCASEPSPARLHHVVPGGVQPSDEGARLADAVAAAVRACAPEVDTTPLPMGERPDLVVLASDVPLDPDARTALHLRGCAHLSVALGPSRGTVGPLVLPGLTSCLGCADRHRLDRDPAWSALAVQLALPHRAVAAADVAVATAIAGIAALQALEFLDGGRPATVEGTLELQLPDWRLRRRSWPVHTECGCMASAPTG